MFSAVWYLDNGKGGCSFTSACFLNSTAKRLPLGWCWKFETLLFCKYNLPRSLFTATKYQYISSAELCLAGLGPAWINYVHDSIFCILFVMYLSFVAVFLVNLIIFFHESWKCWFALAGGDVVVDVYNVDVDHTRVLLVRASINMMSFITPQYGWWWRYEWSFFKMMFILLKTQSVVSCKAVRDGDAWDQSGRSQSSLVFHQMHS